MPAPQLGVIFDMDGVLVDSAEAHFAAWRRLGEEVGTPHERSFFNRTFGMHNREIIPQWLGPAVPRDDVERLSERKEALYRDVAATTLEPLDGVIELVEALAQEGFLLAVGSSGPPPNVELALEVLGARDLFRALSTAADVSEGKPHPEVFLRAAEKLGLPPSRCVVVEDAPQGVEAGLRAGCKVIAVASTRPRAELSAAHIVVDGLRELSPARIRSLLGDG
jgi:beta-phosphoglucomutase family hydrolase